MSKITITCLIKFLDLIFIPFRKFVEAMGVFFMLVLIYLIKPRNALFGHVWNMEIFLWSCVFHVKLN